jgi:hypothetical protein
LTANAFGLRHQGMPALPATLRLYLKLAIDRRQILARHLAMRVGIGAMAGIVLLVGIALLNVALFLLLRPWLGDLWSVLAVAVLHLAAGGLLAVFALSSPKSAELTALAEAEAAALQALDSDAHDKLAALTAAEQRIERLGAGLSLTANALPTLIGLLSRPAKPISPPPADGAAKLPDDKA